MAPTVSITTTAALDAALLDAAGVRPGARVLDVGCGRGDTTFDAARRVGPSGLALGVDASLTVLERARRRAADAGLAHVGFVHADPQQQRFAPLRFDSIVSRRARHVFADPDAGFTNLLRALRSGGRSPSSAPTRPTACAQCSSGSGSSTSRAPRSGRATPPLRGS